MTQTGNMGHNSDSSCLIKTYPLGCSGDFAVFNLAKTCQWLQLCDKVKIFSMTNTALCFSYSMVDP
jgi:hypothetical protein